MLTDRELRLLSQCVEHVARGADNLELNDLLAHLETAADRLRWMDKLLRRREGDDNQSQ